MSALAWVLDPIDGAPRLFAGGLDGALTEWDGRTGRSLRTDDSFGGAVWALAAEPAGALQPGAHEFFFPLIVPSKPACTAAQPPVACSGDLLHVSF